MPLLACGAANTRGIDSEALAAAAIVRNSRRFIDASLDE
jgi:hypothetical protein